MSRHDGGPAFPTEHGFNGGGEVWDRRGMSLRDYFAAKALAALIVWDAQVNDPRAGESQRKNVAYALVKNAYEMADAMLAERAK